MNTLNKNFDALLVIAAGELINDVAEYARSIDTSNTHISEKTIRKIKRRIKRAEHTSAWESLPISLRRAVAAVLVACTAAFGVCMSIEPVRAAIVETVIEWCDKFVSIFYIPSATPPDTIEEYREPQLQIAGTEKVVMTQTKILYQTTYVSDSGILIDYRQMPINSVSSDVDNENCSITEINIFNHNGHLFLHQNGRLTLTWHDNSYRYSISSFSPDITLETLISIAESIK